MTSAAPEPTAQLTEAEYDRAADVVTVLYGMDLINYDGQDDALEPIARALAAAVAAEREKYLRVAEELIKAARATDDVIAKSALSSSALAIREVSR